MQKFIIGPGVESGQTVIITGQDARHISRVLRLGKGDTLSMTDGKGQDYSGCIVSAGREQVSVQIKQRMASATESFLALTLCTGMLKHNKMDEIIRQAVQIGVTQWIPFYCARSVPKVNPKKEARQVERWHTIAEESVKQCRRSRLLAIHEPVPFEQTLAHVRDCIHKIAFWEQGGAPLSTLSLKAQGDTDHSSAAILIGPEGGFDVEEIKMAEKSGFKTYSLGPRILRAETAAVCAAGLVQFVLGDMGGHNGMV